MNSDSDLGRGGTGSSSLWERGAAILDVRSGIKSCDSRAGWSERNPASSAILLLAQSAEKVSHFFERCANALELLIAAVVRTRRLGDLIESFICSVACQMTPFLGSTGAAIDNPRAKPSRGGALGMLAHDEAFRRTSKMSHGHSGRGSCLVQKSGSKLQFGKGHDSTRHDRCGRWL